MSRALAALLLLAPVATAQNNPDGVVGESRCKTCHADEHAKWDGSRHSKMVQPATKKSVLGDFDRETVRLRGEDYGLRTEGGTFYISESFFTGRRREHQVRFTLGNRRIQHYLSTLEDGRIIVLPPSWDVLRKEWFHNLDIAAPDQQEGEIPVQLWNKNCFGCHVSEEIKKYDVGARRYDTEWLDFGTSCERCHGPGQAHVERYENGGTPSTGGDIVVPTRLAHDRNSMVCAQCHSFRDVIAFGFTPGEDYYDYFMPLLEYSQEPSKDPTWWPDGKTRRFSTNALGIWQSECFLEGGVACTTCHADAHEPEIETNFQLRADKRVLCTRCHEKIGNDVSAHTFHDESRRGSSCVECHMPRSVVSIKAKIRDHSISIPAPENTIRHGIPNACNLCHEDQTPEWAVEALGKWYPGSRKRDKIEARALAFASARAGEPGATERLLALFRDENQGPIPRANALGHLGRLQDPRVFPTLAGALEDEHPLVRGIAALQMGGLPTAYKQPAAILLSRAIVDEKRLVRMNAAISLLNLGITKLDGEAGERFEEAKRDHVARGAFHSDDPAQLMNLGRLHVLNGEPERAEEVFENSYALDPEQPGIRFFMAVTRLGQDRKNEARKLLENVAEDDPFAQAARALLERLRD
ncbi:MAG TPA: ammonia-forming cytochrome c nitrite reductase subunit c552 [Vicinamibacteria bacterium]|nr:ammonia-forming cytochrome c nitrite reductase subunit c552 [Vicinamibacteria bacterium]